MHDYIEKYIYVLKGKQKKIPAIVLLFLLASVLDLLGIGLVGPFIISMFSPEGMTDKQPVLFEIFHSIGVYESQLVAGLGVALVVVFYLKGVGAYFVNRVIVRFSLDHQAEIIKLLMKSYQNMPYEEHLDRNSSSLVNAVSGHVRLYTEQTLMASLKLMAEFIVFLVIIMLLAVTNFYATLLLSLLLISIFLFYDRVVKKTFQEAGRETANSTEKIIQGVRESVGSIKEIRVLGKNKYFFDRVSDAADNYARYGSKAQAIQNIPRYLLESAVITFVVILAIYTYTTGQSPAESIALLGMFAVAAVRLLPSVYQISIAFSNIRFSTHHLYELYKDLTGLESYLNKKTKLNSGKMHTANSGNGFTELRLEHIYYRYHGNDTYAIKDISLKVRKGECLGVVGKSGSGKTTLVDIVLGLLTPEKGNIYLNNSELNDCLDDWRQLVAYIPQDVCMIDDTLRRNIALGINDSEIDEKRLVDSINVAQLSKVVRGLKSGLDTNIGEGGVKLSGGQKQRVALARAIYHQREVIIMDEATSALDLETERQVVEEIHQLKGFKTFIVISHRLETLKECNRIIRIESGMIE